MIDFRFFLYRIFRNILKIAAGCRLPPLATLRDIIFSIWAIYWLFICLWNREIRLFDSIGFLCLYGVYILTVIGMSVWKSRNASHEEQVVWNVDEQVDDQEMIVGGNFMVKIQANIYLKKEQMESTKIRLMMGSFLTSWCFPGRPKHWKH
jgi:Ca2+/Na+ antiporter